MNKNTLFFIAKFVVSGLLIWFIAANFEIGAAAERLKDIQYIYILAAFVVFLVLLLNNTVRWQIVLDALHAELPFKNAAKILYISIFFNQTLPSAIGGDAFRMFLSRKAGVDLKSAVNGVMLERVTTLSGLILLVLVTQPFLLARIGDNPAKYAFPVLAGLAVAGIIFLMLLDRVPARFQNWKIARGLGHLATDTKKLFLSPSHAIKAILLGVVGNILIALMAYMTALALAIEVSLLDCLVLIPPVILVLTLPISIAGWGVREGAMVAAFAFVGVVEGDAFVMSILFGLIGVVFALPGGLLWLIGGYSREEVEEELPK
jgi:glycosyltransferase 2 family protein